MRGGFLHVTSRHSAPLRRGDERMPNRVGRDSPGDPGLVPGGADDQRGAVPAGPPTSRRPGCARRSGQDSVLAEVMDTLAAGLGAPLNLQVNVAEPTGMEDGMLDEQRGSPVARSLPPAGGLT